MLEKEHIGMVLTTILDPVMQDTLDTQAAFMTQPLPEYVLVETIIHLLIM
jgi:hypothetical protein